MKKIDERTRKIITVILSILLPGLGQVVEKQVRRGIVIFLAVFTAIGTAAWYGEPAWFILPGLIWIWNIWDAWNCPKMRGIILPVLFWLILAYGIGSQVTEFRLSALFENPSRVSSILKQMTKLDYVQLETEVNKAYVEIQTPCSDDPFTPDRTTDGKHVYVLAECANVGDAITVKAEGFWPNYPTVFTWYNPIGNVGMKQETTTDEQGNAEITWIVLPFVLNESSDPTLPLTHQIQISQTETLEKREVSVVGGFIIKGMYETLSLAFLSTILGALLALPIGFLAARNLMSGNIVTMTFYVIIRTILNFVRSIEALIMAIIFVVIVGLGPFAGMLAITIHTIAALGKLYSEVIEGIDKGPIEAIRSTGANWLQIVRYAVIPQVVPPFTALTIYRWDINVRSSTIVGLVGGGGIGFYLIQWIQLQDYSAVGSVFVAIAVVVLILDFFSARLRERIK